MLPPSEPLALLTPEDAIDVIPYQDTRVDLISNKNDASVSLVNNKRKVCAPDTPYSNRLSVTDSNKRFITSEKNVISSNCSLHDDIDGVNISPALEEGFPEYTNGNGLKSIQKLELQSNNTQTLSNLKQQALALLDSQVAVDTNTTEILDQDSLMPSRRRRRVRKRKGQMQTLSPLEHQSLPDFSAKDFPPTPIDPVPCSEDVTETSNPASPCVEQSSTDRVLLSPQLEVARNNAICSRKPRLVQSLNC